MDPEEFLEKVREAAISVDEGYFGVTTKHGDSPQERVFCYEFYHKLRPKVEGSSSLLTGELDKKSSGYDCDKQPDFLFHVPDKVENLAVIEVKTSNHSLSEWVDAVDKLKCFTSEDGEFGYSLGIFLALATEEADLGEKVRKIKDRIEDQKGLVGIRCTPGNTEHFGDAP